MRKFTMPKFWVTAWFMFFLIIAGDGYLYFRRKEASRQREARVPAELCHEAYLNFYARPKVDVRVIFGYKDARPARFVADRYERMLFIQRILEPCTDKSFACGFTRSRTDADLFTRKINGPARGAPGKSVLPAEEKQVDLRVLQSSAGPDDEENRLDPFQKWRSEYASRSFLQGLSEADAIFYNGHSRGGGGPEFEPPLIRADHEVDFKWYREHELGLIPILNTFEHAPSRLKLLGLYSCASSRHFMDRVLAAKPDLGLITSPRLIYFSDALESSLEALSALLGLQCQEAFQESLNNRRSRASGARVSGFFEEKK
ncbi:MAG: hypothetical protein H7222_17240 [Methylotenera sp.]|nr:hypothetical protein [Oligoflexia bacterium]